VQTALRYLGYRARSEAELRRYLKQRGYLPAAIDAALSRLRSWNYLDDEAFARAWALARAQNRGHGPRRIDQELRSKGVGQALARAAVREAFAEVDESAEAKRLLARRFAAPALKDPRNRAKAAAFLQRRGYSSKVIFDLLGYSTEED